MLSLWLVRVWLYVVGVWRRLQASVRGWWLVRVRWGVAVTVRRWLYWRAMRVCVAVRNLCPSYRAWARLSDEHRYRVDIMDLAERNRWEVRLLGILAELTHWLGVCWCDYDYVWTADETDTGYVMRDDNGY